MDTVATFEALFDPGLASGLSGVQTVPPVDVEAIPVQFLVAGDAPDVGGYIVAFGEKLLSFQSLVEDRAAAVEIDRIASGSFSTVM